jgi:hypothetical protein
VTLDHRKLQRALVIALHDAGFARALREDAAGALAPLGLGAAEQAELARVDPRALATDPLRPRRVMRAIAEEYRASTTMLLARTRRIGALDGFFGSPWFRDAVMQDRALAVALGGYLAAEAGDDALLAGVVALEHARARARREASAPVRPGVGLAPGVAVIEVDLAVLPAMQSVERWLFEVGLMPQILLADDAPRLPPLPAVGAGVEHLLFQPAGAQVSMSSIDADLYTVLAALVPARAKPDARAALVAAGIPSARAPGLLDALLLEGLLSEGPPPGAPLLAGDGVA